MNFWLKYNTKYQFKRLFWTLFLSHFLFNMSLTLYFLYPLFIEDLGGTKVQIGFIMGIALGAGVMIRTLIGSFLDRHGRKIWFIIGGVICSISSLLYLFITHIGILIYVIRILHGIGTGILFTAYFTTIADLYPSQRQVEIMALFGISGLVPMALGPLCGELILGWSKFSTLFVTAGILSFSAFFLTLYFPETAPNETASDQSGPELAGLRPFLTVWIGSFLFGAAVHACFNFLAPFARSQGLAGMSPFFFTYVITSSALRLLYGDIPEKYGILRTYYVASVALFLGLAFTGFATTVFRLMIGGVFVGLGHAFIFPILISLSAQRSTVKSRGRAIAHMTAVLDFGGMACAPLLGYIGDIFGYRVLFSIASIFAIMPLLVFYIFDQDQKPRQIQT
ncbi:MFS transporter [candidate division CSSED10-310 bacterium]|uniref:MFS transporter n=1 Tax=candidate division CSSED10-310 bacterium TaxID=2855610 RepID=A0ABV6YVU2_UNCC1